MAYSSAATAYEYAKRWLALDPDDPDAQKLVRDCEEYLEAVSYTHLGRSR